MVEIPVQEKSGIPWWVWALLALLVVGLLIWWLGRDDEFETAAIDSSAPVAASSVDTGPITELSTIFGTSDMNMLVGREVQLSNVAVQEVVGDRTFWVGPSMNERAFVVLNEQPTPGQPGVEGRYDVTAGQTINVNGVMRNPSAPEFGGQPIEGLPTGQQAVVHAQSLDIVQRP